MDTKRREKQLDNKEDPLEYHTKEVPDKGQGLTTNIQGVVKAHILDKPALYVIPVKRRGINTPSVSQGLLPM